MDSIPPRPSRSRRIIWSLLGVATIAGAFTPLPSSVNGTARVVPARTLTLEALTIGELKQVYRGEGDSVMRGNVIARIHNGDYENDLVQSAKEVEVIGKQLEQLLRKREYLAKVLARNKDLHDEQVIAITELEATELEHNQTLLEIEIKNKKLESLRMKIAFLRGELAHAQVKAPIDGTLLGPIANKLGKWLSKGTELCQIFDPKEILLELPVYEKEVRDIALGQEARIRFSAFGPENYSGKVREILPVAWEKLEKVWVKENVINVMIRTDGMPQGLKPGMTAKVRILCGKTPLWKQLLRKVGF